MGLSRGGAGDARGERVSAAEALPCARPLHSFVFFIGPKLSAKLADIFLYFLCDDLCCLRSSKHILF